MRVRLIKKFADIIDGVDLRGRSVGDLLNLKPREAKLLLAEQWAVPGGNISSHFASAAAGDSGKRRNQNSDTTVLRRRS
jgi:hypothetical protein